MTRRLTVDIVICTRNRSKLLGRTLQSIVDQILADQATWRVIVVDNGSSDDTQTVARSFEGRLPILVATESRPGLSIARNAALKLTNADYVLWTDDDVKVRTNWLAEFVRAASEFPNAGVIGGRIIPEFAERPDPTLVAAFPVLADGFCGLDYHRSSGPLPRPCLVWGANMGYKSTAIKDKLFNEHLGPSPSGALGGDETELQLRLVREGWEVVWWPDLAVDHWVPLDRMTLEYLCRYTKAKGRDILVQEMLSNPAGSGRRAPLWLIREYLNARIREFLMDLGVPQGFPQKLRSGNSVDDPDPAVRRLVARRERLFLEGMIRAYKTKREWRGRTN